MCSKVVLFDRVPENWLIGVTLGAAVVNVCVLIP